MKIRGLLHNSIYFLSLKLQNFDLKPVLVSSSYHGLKANCWIHVWVKFKLVWLFEISISCASCIFWSFESTESTVPLIWGLFTDLLTKSGIICYCCCCCYCSLWLPIHRSFLHSRYTLKASWCNSSSGNRMEA